jgi:hypothetical protein
MKADYEGPLYQVRVGSSEFNIGGLRVTNPVNGPMANQPYQTTPEAGTLLDIPQGPDGFVDASVLEGACKMSAVVSNPVCSVVKLYDHSGNGTDIGLALGGLSNGGTYADYDNFETVMNQNARLTVGGRTVYSLYMGARNGYRIEEIGAAMPLEAEPQGVYMLADGTHAGSACCWDFGNVTTNPASYGEMNTLFFGQAYWGKGSGSPPWWGADFEAGVWMGGSVASDPGWGGLNNPNPTGNPNSPSFAGVKFALGFLKTDDDNDQTYALRMANIETATSVHEAYRGPHPKHTDNLGAVVLGVGGDNSNNSFGTFYEGAITVGFPTDEAEQGILENIQAVGYGE